MVTPSDVGARSERELAFALERDGWHVYLPMFAAHARVDLVAIRDDRAMRVQVKTGRVTGDVISFRACSNTNNVARDYRGEVDAFGVYSPELDRCYLVPIDVTATRTCSLRLVPPVNGQRKRIRLAAEYELRRPG